MGYLNLPLNTFRCSFFSEAVTIQTRESLCSKAVKDTDIVSLSTKHQRVICVVCLIHGSCCLCFFQHHMVTFISSVAPRSCSDCGSSFHNNFLSFNIFICKLVFLSKGSIWALCSLHLYSSRLFLLIPWRNESHNFNSVSNWNIANHFMEMRITDFISLPGRNFSLKCTSHLSNWDQVQLFNIIYFTGDLFVHFFLCIFCVLNKKGTV